YLSASEDNFINELSKAPSSREQIIVLDDMQSITEPELQEKLLSFIAERNNSFIIIGRANAVPYLKPFEITRQMVSFSEKDLALDMDEISELLVLNGIEHSMETVEQLLKISRGWAISVVHFIKKLKSGKAFDKSTITEVKYDIYDCFDFKLFIHWDSEIQSFLMAVSNFDIFNEQMASMITGKSDILQMIRYLLQIGSFLHFTPPDTYFLQPFMREYLQKKQNELCSKELIARQIQNAGLYYALNGNLARAIECYYKAGDTDKVAELLTENSIKHPGNAQFYGTEKYYLFLPEDTVKKSPELMSGMSMLHSLCCRLEESEQWFNELVKFKEKIDKADRRYKIAREKIAYLNIALPHRGSRGMSEMIRSTAALCMVGGTKLQEISVTGNMPSLLNGGKDFCEWLSNDKMIYGLLKKPIEIALGKSGVGLANVALGESLFEKNIDENYTEALTRLNNGLSEAETNGTAQMQFAAIGIMARLFAADGSIDTAVEMMKSFRQKIISTDEYLLPNVEAIMVRQQLKLNNLFDVDMWMNEKAPNEHNNFYILDRYGYITKVRCYLFKEQYLEALSLLDKLQYYYKIYHRTYGELETKILLAVTLFRTGDDKWKEIINEVLTKCEGYGLIRIVADEGMAVLPILERFKPDCSQTFYKNIMKAVKNQARLYPNYLQPPKKVNADLTVNETKVLKLLAHGMKNEEIANMMELSVNTVKTHLKRIFSKLDVSTRAQAIKVANEMNLI
ncbi:MAG: LuxR C-terminal-related transcriptional regulator, partial [Christensenellaceae bacterium]